MENWEGKTFLQLHPLFQFAPTYLGHMPFFPPVEAMHAVTRITNYYL